MQLLWEKHSILSLYLELHESLMHLFTFPPTFSKWLLNLLYWSYIFSQSTCWSGHSFPCNELGRVWFTIYFCLFSFFLLISVSYRVLITCTTPSACLFSVITVAFHPSRACLTLNWSPYPFSVVEIDKFCCASDGHCVSLSFTHKMCGPYGNVWHINWPTMFLSAFSKNNSLLPSTQRPG